MCPVDVLVPEPRLKSHPHIIIASLVIASMLAFGPVNSYAQTQYWVSVGSYENPESAERGLRNAEGKLAAAFAVVGVETGKGFYYRVASGPYASRASAQDQVGNAHALGFDGAWIWVGDDNDFSAAQTSTSGYAESSYSEKQLHRNQLRRFG